MSESEVLKNRVFSLPDSVFYIPNFITTMEETNLMENIYKSPKPKWRNLSDRRLQNWGGLPHPKGMIQEDMPKWLMDYVKKVNELRVFGEKQPNHVLINEYLPGQGIMPHEDGPLFYPTITTINLGSHTVIDYYEKSSMEENSVMENPNNRYIGSLYLERRSLLIVQDSMYTNHLHGIKVQKIDKVDENIKNLAMCSIQQNEDVTRDTRISVTIRHVPHTIKSRFIFGKK